MVGIVRKPAVITYWSRDGMVEAPFFSKTISRDCYRKLLKNLHFCDNTLYDGSDKLFKIRSLLDAFSGSFRTTYLPAKHIFVHESLLKFHSRLQWKQYNPSKRSRFGMKLYRLCGSDGPMCGYTWNVKLCNGQDRDDSLPASTKVVVDLSMELLGKGYHKI